MRVAISTTRPFHSALLANALHKHSASVQIYSSAPRRYFRGLDPAVSVRLVPSVLQTAMHFLHCEASDTFLNADSWLYDRSVAAVLGPADIFIGWATASLASSRAARRRGARFVLDRACPHVEFQQALVSAEAAKVGYKFTPQPDWFRQRQIDEYAEAERILIPSEYTRRSFPQEFQAKTIKAPLLGRCSFPAEARLERNPVFTVGVVGGDPLRKGYLYLLRAWKQLALPNARLLIRSSADFRAYPVLAELVASMANVELLPYVPDINDFYRQCDAFVLPSIDDGFGMALFEAMANAVPCIATTHCGSAEHLTPGKDGIVVEPFREDQIGASIESLYEPEELCRSLAMAGRQTIAGMMRGGDSSPLYDAAIGSLLASFSTAEAHALA